MCQWEKEVVKVAVNGIDDLEVIELAEREIFKKRM
jgi:hypothetical protein